MHVPRTSAALLAAAALVLPSGCALEKEDETSQPSMQSSSMPSPDVATGDSKKCLARQAPHALPASAPLQRMTERVLSGAGRSSVDDAVARFAAAISKAVSRTRKACGGGATALDALVELVRTASDEGVDEPLLRRIVQAFEEWGRVIGRPRTTQILYAADPCTILRKDVRASYEIRRRPQGDGVDVAVELLLENDLEKVVLLSHAGDVESTGERPDGASGSYRWGSSSSDFLEVAPGRTSRAVVDIVPAAGPDVDSVIQLLPHGDVRVVDVHAWASLANVTCSIPVKPAG